MEIQPNVHWIEGRASNVFLCIDPAGLALVDTGMPGMQDSIFAEIQRLGFQPTDLNRIVITHADIDHVGSLAAIQSTSGATVFAGTETASTLATRQISPTPAAPYAMVCQLLCTL